VKKYVVGGVVRDELLGLPVADRDWVVVGATPEDMVRQGFRPVGKDFPVFLHPETHEEYALARTERKSGRGYKGFTVHAAPDVTLEADLARRDLTINAMARDEAGRLIDPYGGEKDLREGVLRHVSEAFEEDPVRILRVARFVARFGFRIAPETRALMRRMVDSGEADHLVDHPHLIAPALQVVHRGAVVLGASHDGAHGILSTRLRTDGSYVKTLYVPAGGSLKPASLESVKRNEHTITMNGKEVFKVAVRSMEEISREALDEAEVKVDEVSLVIPHQANLRIITALAGRLKVPMTKVMVNVDRYGNTSAGSIPIALDEAVREGRVKDGDVILFVAFGGGLTWASAALKW